MKKNKKKKEHFRGPVSTLLVIMAIVSIISLVLSLIDFQGSKTYIGTESLETSVIVVRNVLSIDGLKYLLGSAIENFVTFRPLAIMIISLIGIGICEKSGLLKAIFFKMKKIKFEIIIFMTLFLGIISSVIGEYSYMFLIPLIGLMYKYLDRSSTLGIMVVFVGITLGYGTGLIFNYEDYSLGVLTQAAANLDVDPNYKYNLLSNIYIMVVSTFIITFIATLILNRFLVIKFPKKEIAEEEVLYVSKKGINLSSLVAFIMLSILAYTIIDIKLPGAGILLDKSQTTYVAKLFSETAPFREGIVIIITLIMMVCGFVYGKISGNIKDSHEYSLGLSKNFENLGMMFVLMFFMSQLIAILDWTRIGDVISVRLVDFVSSMQISGLPLILIFMLIVIIMSILIPDLMTKWELLSPTVIPLFMRSNITPDFTQFIFKIADSIGKCLTPFFIYFIIELAFLEKYRVDDKKQISIFGTLKLMMPSILLIGLSWILLIVIWYIVGIPIGVGTYSTI